MAWPIRSAADISARLRGAFRRYLPGTDTALKNNLVTIIVKVVALIAHEFELRMAALSKQFFLTTATDLRWIRLHASEIGIYQKPASAATGMITGTGGALTTYPSGIRFVSGSTVYVSTAAATSGADGTIALMVVSEEKGVSGNRDSGGLLSLADPALYPDLGSEWVVDDAGLGGGADIEDKESLRVRALARKRNPPGGGTLTDYERIVTDISGVMKAWAFRPHNAPGMLILYFLFAGRDGFIPLPSDVAVVQAAIDAKRLVRVDDGVAVAPIARAIDITISDLSGDTVEIRAEIDRAMSAMFASKCRPGVPGSPFILPRSWISEVISGVSGEDRHTLAYPDSDVVLGAGEFPVKGVVSYVS